MISIGNLNIREHSAKLCLVWWLWYLQSHVGLIIRLQVFSNNKLSRLWLQPFSVPVSDAAAFRQDGPRKFG